MNDQIEGISAYAPPARVSDGAYFQSLEEYQKLYFQSLDNPEAFWVPVGTGHLRHSAR